MRLDCFEATFGRSIKLQIKVGESDNGFGVVVKVLFDRYRRVTLYYVELLDIRHCIFLLMIIQQLDQKFFVSGSYGVGPFGDVVGVTVFIRQRSIAREGIKSNDASREIVRFVHSAKRLEEHKVLSPPNPELHDYARRIQDMLIKFV